MAGMLECVRHWHRNRLAWFGSRSDRHLPARGFRRRFGRPLGVLVEVVFGLGDLMLGLVLLHTVRMQSPDAGKQVRARGEDGKATVVTLTVI